MTDLERRAREYAKWTSPFLEADGLHEETAWLAGYRAAVADAAKVLDGLDDFPDLNQGQMRFGLRCGVEDRDIHDRYEAAEYGFEDAAERCAEWAKNQAAAIRKLPEKEPSDE